jgi:hypothetical protein
MGIFIFAHTCYASLLHTLSSSVTYFALLQIPPQPDPGTNPPVRTITLTGVGDAGERAKYEIDILLSGDNRGAHGGGRNHDPYGYGQQQAYGMVSFCN